MKKCVEQDNDIYVVQSDHKCFEIQQNSGRNVYPVVIEFPSSASYKEKTVGIIDSGAANTAITIKALFRTMSDTQYGILKNAISNSKATRKSFSSAGHVDDLTGVLCMLPQIKINNYVINDFRFYLIDNRDRSIVLIGYDFTSSCDIVQMKDSYMAIYNFDQSSMNLKMEGDDTLDLLSLSLSP